MRRAPDGRLLLAGELSFATVPRLWETSRNLLREDGDLHIDLKDVQRSDSAGLALLVEWMRVARQLGKPIEFLNIPAQMLAIARVSSLDQILPLSRG
ncbi:MAG: STAS domain-containing protein [Gammaproteobacteria bacterium]|nr:STAS domain-containing protein [Gammaproteobacteria bacterium]